MSIESNIRQAFTPSGALRVALNMGNPVLAHSRTAHERPAGVSIDIAREFARRIGCDAVTLLPFDTPGEAWRALADGQADIGFLAIDPQRGAQVHFTQAYVQIEGSYLVRNDSPLKHCADVDRPGIDIVVGQQSAYDLFLSRAIQAAQLVRVPTSEEVADAMLRRPGLQVAAGIRQQLEADARRIGAQGIDSVRLLEGCFMVIQQAMVMPRQRGEAAEAFLERFIDDMKTSGFVADALQRHGIEGATVVQGKGSVA